MSQAGPQHRQPRGREAGRPRAHSSLGNILETKAKSATAEGTRWNFCLRKHAPSTSRWSLGGEAMTQTWHIFCGLVGFAGALRPMSTSVSSSGVVRLPDSLHCACGLPQAHAHTLLPLEEAFGEEFDFFFFNQENTASIHLGLPAQAYTHKHHFKYFL